MAESWKSVGAQSPYKITCPYLCPYCYHLYATVFLYCVLLPSSDLCGSKFEEFIAPCVPCRFYCLNNNGLVYMKNCPENGNLISMDFYKKKRVISETEMHFEQVSLALCVCVCLN